MYIKGVGCTRFCIGQEPFYKMISDAVSEALDDAGISLREIDFLVSSNNHLASNGERQRHPSSLLSSILGVDIPILNIQTSCDGGSSALWTALSLGSGDNDGDSNNLNNLHNFLVIGFDRMVSNTAKILNDELMMDSENIYHQSEGVNPHVQNAFIAQQYIDMHGATKEDFSLVAFKNHENGFLNPKARFYKKKITLKQIRDSPVVASPLRLFDCSTPANGAAAVILSKEKTDIEIAGSGFSVDRLPVFESSDLTSWSSAKKAAEQAFREAKITPADIDIAEVHDAFTPAEIIAYEDIGFAKKGEGYKLIRDKSTFLDGKIPVNTSGGLKAKGHPISATGLSQIYELTKQLRNEAGERQVSNPKYALSHNIGGAGSSSVVHILRKV